jgi:hypothetical protein
MLSYQILDRQNVNLQGFIKERQYEINKAVKKCNYASIAWQIYMLSMIEQEQ